MDYQDLDQIGTGGFGKVVRCSRSEDGVVFAKKILVNEMPDAIKRFQREVRILEKLSHPRVIRVEAAHITDKPYWFVMPLYRRSLRALIPATAGDRKRIASVFIGILDGMEYAHKQGVIHRDLKPENILLDDSEDPVISDFGLGRAIEALTSRATGSNAWIGTPAYMAPEQMTDAENADHRSDIFSLGKILYDLYTGEPPAAVPDLSKLPIGLAAVARRCMKTRPEDRFQTVRELRQSFDLVAVSRVDVSGEAELRALVGEISAQMSISFAQIERLAELISQCQDDAELLHEITIPLPLAALAALATYDSAIFKVLGAQFAKVAVEQSWPFSYTDDIGSACRRMFDATCEPDLKAMMAKTALIVGAEHNRFQVMAQTAAMINDAKTNEDAFAMAHALETASDQLWAVRDRLEIRKLHPEIRELFERGSG